MTAATQAVQVDDDAFTRLALPLAIGANAFDGARACIDIVAGTVKPMAAGNVNLVPVGNFVGSTNNTAGGSTVQTVVEFDHEIVGRWLDNSTGGTAVTTLFADCFMADNNTVSNTSNSGANAKAGRVWKIDSVRGVFVESYTL